LKRRHATIKSHFRPRAFWKKWEERVRDQLITDRMNACVDFAREKQLNLPQQVLFGPGCLIRLAEGSAGLSLGRRALILTGAGSAHETGTDRTVEKLLRESGFSKVSRFGFHGEPDVATVDQAAEQCRAGDFDLVVGVGGGSVLDCAKAVAGMARHDGSVADYLEGVGSSTLSQAALPGVAISTISGTGAEMTRNAVITVPDRRVKRSLRHQSLMVRVAIIDPKLTVTVPPAVTAMSGMDGVTQLLESAISAKRRPETVELALAGLEVARRGLVGCHERPDDLEARTGLAFAAGLSGICLANSGLGLVHGIASGLGGHRRIPHGLICAVLLPHALEYNRDAAKPGLRASLASFLNTPERSSTIEEGIAAIRQMNEMLGIPPHLRFLSLTSSEIPAVARDSMGSSMSGNPVPMTVEMVVEFLEKLA